MNKNDLPKGWIKTALTNIAYINPSKPSRNVLSDDTVVSFVPMSAVASMTGKIKLSTTKKVSDIRKGYTYFRNNDIIFAKITPCMEVCVHLI